MPNDLPTYCDHCGRNFDARYNANDGLTTLACPQCPDVGISWGIQDVASLPAASRATIQRLLERTGAKEGNAAPPLPPCLRNGPDAILPPVYPMKATPLETHAPSKLIAKIVDVSPLVDSMATVTALIEDLVRAFVQACGLPGAEPGKPLDPFKLVPRTPSVGPVYQFRPITTLFPPLPPVDMRVGLPSITLPPVTIKPVTQFSAEELEKAIEKLRRVQRKEDC